jgi:hypothetical protein
VHEVQVRPSAAEAAAVRLGDHRAALVQSHRGVPRSAHRRGTVIVVGLVLLAGLLVGMWWLIPVAPQPAAVVGPSDVVSTSSTVVPASEERETPSGSPSSFPDEDIPQRVASATLSEQIDQGDSHGS